MIGSPTAPQVRTLRVASSWISLRRESDTARLASQETRGQVPRPRLARSNGSGNSRRARFALEPRLRGEKVCHERGSRRFWGTAERRAAVPANRRPGPSNALTFQQMSNPLAASDFWPLILKLPHDERVRLAKLALRAASHDDSSAGAYAAAPPAPDEFSSDDEPLAWEGQGWEEFGASR